MSKLRLRHPKGVATLELDLETASVQDLQQQIRAISDVFPSQQELKYGYPPRQLTLIPELPVSSLGLKAGDQIILTPKPGSFGSSPIVSSTVSAAAPTPASPATVRGAGTQARVAGSASAGAAPQPAGVGFAAPTGGETESIRTDSGVLVHRVVPDDNSCLFSSVALVFEQDISKAQLIRTIVANAIGQDAETWNEAILGLPRERYVQTILKPSTWGGAIELSVLATHYNTEIASIDVETGRIDHFTPSSLKPSSRCVLIYSGIHYDAASLAPMEDAPPDFHQTVFPIEGGDPQSDTVLRAASALADKLRAKRAYTNTATFDLRCEVCKAGLKGEKGAREHATQTGHTAFGEY